jgi:hypothetical protein
MKAAKSGLSLGSSNKKDRPTVGSVAVNRDAGAPQEDFDIDDGNYLYIQSFRTNYRYNNVFDIDFEIAFRVN